jgi:pimeloyl-ACP methyl ester carboxylesterase
MNQTGGGPRLVTEEFRIPASDPGIELYVRNKHPESMQSASGEKVVLFVHGATYPSSTTFDLALNGMSWMDYIARQGYDVYLLDVRGYGLSSRPGEMSEPPEKNAPLVRTETAMKDVASAVDFIRKRRGVERINLLAWSWGTRIMGWYTAQNNEKVNKLILYAPGWIRATGASLPTRAASSGLIARCRAKW